VVQFEQTFQEFCVCQRRRPAVRSEHSFIQLAMRLRETFAIVQRGNVFLKCECVAGLICLCGRRLSEYFAKVMKWLCEAARSESVLAFQRSTKVGSDSGMGVCWNCGCGTTPARQYNAQPLDSCSAPIANSSHLQPLPKP
jgi:hypothetical protein